MVLASFDFSFLDSVKGHTLVFPHFVIFPLSIFVVKEMALTVGLKKNVTKTSKIVFPPILKSGVKELRAGAAL